MSEGEKGWLQGRDEVLTFDMNPRDLLFCLAVFGGLPLGLVVLDYFGLLGWDFAQVKQCPEVRYFCDNWNLIEPLVEGSELSSPRYLALEDIENLRQRSVSLQGPGVTS